MNNQTGNAIGLFFIVIGFCQLVAWGVTSPFFEEKVDLPFFTWIIIGAIIMYLFRDSSGKKDSIEVNNKITKEKVKKEDASAELTKELADLFDVEDKEKKAKEEELDEHLAILRRHFEKRGE